MTREIGSALVVGTGLVGTSVALALRRAGVDVHLRDDDAAAAAFAAERGAGVLAPPDAPVDIAVVAVPPAAVGAVAAGLLHHDEALWVTDVASVKARPQRDVEAACGPLAARFCGGHPLAGRERTGPAAARDDLFEDRPWVLTPGARTDPAARTAALTVARLCGGVPVILDPTGHDEAVAVISHAPQVVASAMAARLRDAPPDVVALSGQGVRDVTRLAASDADLWTDILTANAGPVAEVVATVADALQALAVALRSVAADGSAGTAQIRRLLADGAAGRARIPGKHGAEPISWDTVHVVISDRHGELARLLAAADAAGVNVEDVAIEHSPREQAGLVELCVAPGAGERLAAALSAAGWAVHG